MRNTVEHVVTGLVSAGLVDPARSRDAEMVTARALAEAQLPAAAHVGAGTPRATTRSRLVEIAAYVGGALVVASVGLFLAQEWGDLSEAVQVATLGVIALLLGVAGGAASWVGGGYAELRAGRDEVRRRLTSALLVGASLAGAFTVSRLVSTGVDDYASSMPVLAGSLAMLVLAALAYTYVSSALGVLAMGAAAWMAIVSSWFWLDGSGWQSLVPALTMLAFAAAWLVLTETHRFRERTVARTVGMAAALFGAQVALAGDHADVAYAFTFAVAAAGFAMYLRTASWPYLAAGVLGITIVVPEAVIDWTGGALGPAGAVLVAGLTLLGASLAGFRVRKEVEQPDTAPVTERNLPALSAGRRGGW